MCRRHEGARSEADQIMQRHERDAQGGIYLIVNRKAGTDVVLE